jgi:hypothetical protein
MNIVESPDLCEAVSPIAASGLGIGLCRTRSRKPASHATLPLVIAQLRVRHPLAGLNCAQPRRMRLCARDIARPWMPRALPSAPPQPVDDCVKKRRIFSGPSLRPAGRLVDNLCVACAPKSGCATVPFVRR